LVKDRTTGGGKRKYFEGPAPSGNRQIAVITDTVSLEVKKPEEKM